MKSPRLDQGLLFDIFHGAAFWARTFLPGTETGTNTMADPDGKTLAKTVFAVVLYHCVKDNWPYEDEVRHFDLHSLSK